MRKKALLLGGVFSAVWLASCGGGGLGSDISGLYGLEVSLDSASIYSPASEFTSNNVPGIPADTISGKVVLRYYGNSANPMRGVIKRADLCIDGTGCYNLGVGGILEADKEKIFSVDVKAHKYGNPWITLNVYEDEAVSAMDVTDVLAGGVQSGSISHTYSGGTSVVQGDPHMVAGSVGLQANGTFNASYVYPGYDSAQGTVNFTLSLGGGLGNSVVSGSFQAAVAGITCVDDGSGNIVESGGGTNCSGTIDYGTGDVSISVSNVTTPSDMNITYQISGSLVCSDTGSGTLAGDCSSSSVDYNTGSISYVLSYQPVFPVSVSILYLYRVGTADGLNFYYYLPQNVSDSSYPFIKTMYGENIRVVKGGVTVCDNAGNTSECTLTVNGREVHVQFATPQDTQIDIVYSARTYYDFNSAVDARATNHLWNGQSSAIVNGSIRVEVELEDGTDLSASYPVSFDVVGQK